MRVELSKYEGNLITLTGKFVRYGKTKTPKNIHNKNTVLLSDLHFDDGRPVCSHLWFTAKRAFLFTELKVGAVIQVTGTVSSYERKDGTKDFSVESCSNIEIVKQGKRLLPSRVWEDSFEMVFKFIFNDGPMWYRIIKETKKVERLYLKFLETEIEKTYEDVDETESEFILKTVNTYLVLGSKLKFINYS